MQPLILTVDLAGLPQAWVELEEAITYHAKQIVAWSVSKAVAAASSPARRRLRQSRAPDPTTSVSRGTRAA